MRLIFTVTLSSLFLLSHVIYDANQDKEYPNDKFYFHFILFLVLHLR